jgi:hypothetical protein
MREFEMHRFAFSIIPIIQASMRLLILLVGFFSLVAPLPAQTPFPLPQWFRNNISRPPVDDKSRAAADYLSSLNKEGKLSLTEADVVRLVLENKSGCRGGSVRT